MTKICQSTIEVDISSQTPPMSTLILHFDSAYHPQKGHLPLAGAAPNVLPSQFNYWYHYSEDLKSQQKIHSHISRA